MLLCHWMFASSMGRLCGPPNDEIWMARPNRRHHLWAFDSNSYSTPGVVITNPATPTPLQLTGASVGQLKLRSRNGVGRDIQLQLNCNSTHE